MQGSSRKNERKKQRSMALNLLRKGMTLSSKHQVDVLVVVFDRASGAFQEFCSTELTVLVEKMMAERSRGGDYTTYKLEDMAELPEDTQEVSPAPSKHSRTMSPQGSETSSLAFLAPRERPKKPPTSKPPSKDKEIAGFLALLKPPFQKPTAPSAPTISTEDTAEFVPSSSKETILQEKLREERLEEEEEWKYSPSDFLSDL